MISESKGALKTATGLNQNCYGLISFPLVSFKIEYCNINRKSNNGRAREARRSPRHDCGRDAHSDSQGSPGHVTPRGPVHAASPARRHGAHANPAGARDTPNPRGPVHAAGPARVNGAHTNPAGARDTPPKGASARRRPGEENIKGPVNIEPASPELRT